MKKGTGCLGVVFHSFLATALCFWPHLTWNLWIRHFWGGLLTMSCISCVSVLCVCVCVCVYSFGCVRTLRRLSKEPQRTSWSWWQIGDYNCGSLGLTLTHFLQYCISVHFPLPLNVAGMYHSETLLEESDWGGIPLIHLLIQVCDFTLFLCFIKVKYFASWNSPWILQYNNLPQFLKMVYK